MVSSGMTIFSFIDTETTGLSPEEDFILEVAWVLTDEKFNQISEPKTFLINQEDEAAASARVEANPFVLSMHRTSGLWADMAVKPGVSLEYTMNEYVKDVDSVRSSEDVVRFAGYSVSFDKEFLRANGWRRLMETKELSFQLHHRNMDISSNIQLFEAADLEVPYVENENAHRALDDAMHAMKVAQAMRAVITEKAG